MRRGLGGAASAPGHAFVNGLDLLRIAVTVFCALIALAGVVIRDRVIILAGMAGIAMAWVLPIG